MGQLIVALLLIISFIFGGARLLRAADRTGAFGGRSSGSKVIGVWRPPSVKDPPVRALYGVEPVIPVVTPREKDPPIQPLYGVEPVIPVITPPEEDPPVHALYGVEPPIVVRPLPSRNWFRFRIGRFGMLFQEILRKLISGKSV